MNLYQETFFLSAKKCPNNLALWTDKKSFTYHDLYQLTQKWAKVIHNSNHQNSPIAIYGSRQWQMHAGILSILASGSTYVPINNKQPTHRNADILEQIQCVVILIAQGEDPTELLSSIKTPLIVIYLGEDNPHWLNLPSNHFCQQIDKIDFPSSNASEPADKQARYAYILFTSGSTGTPKGIAVTQHNIIRYISRLDNLLAIKPTDKVSQFFELSFDLSVHDLFSCWAKGATLYVIPTNQLLCPTHFIQQHELTVFSAVASILSFTDKFGLLTENNLTSLRLSCFGGEKLLTKQAVKWQKSATNSRVINLYGPTECTITATYYQLDPNTPPNSSSVPIGKALPGLNAILIKDGQKTTEINVLAELYLSGDQLIDGYWKDNNKTDQAFIHTNAFKNKNHPNPERYYRTGDIVYYDNNNDIVFHGRRDHQFKVSGYRVEAADIEACIVSFCASITWCVVKSIEDEFNQQPLVVASIEASKIIKESDLRRYCASQLPSHMVPDKFTFFEYLPRNANGKVNIQLSNTKISH